ncbi:hypothetical protein HZH68_016192 [Vespula germanica]|uniref:Uncharacterized protein n=1 Tax=Vespula germanica TaxID=30212 RepID=A0A834MPA8_VESGE|nr:hypothetical protein HZH68_016192 [Vespula germanica]
MNTSYQRTSDKTVGHSFGGCGTGNKPDSALRYIFATFIQHTSRKLGDTIDCMRKSSIKGRPTMNAGSSSMKSRNESESCLPCNRIKAAATIKKFIE